MDVDKESNLISLSLPYQIYTKWDASKGQRILLIGVLIYWHCMPLQQFANVISPEPPLDVRLRVNFPLRKCKEVAWNKDVAVALCVRENLF